MEVIADDVIPGHTDLKPIPNELSSRLMAISIRAIVRYLEDTIDGVIPDLEIPRGTPVVYELDADLKPVPNEFSSRRMAVPSVPS